MADNFIIPNIIPSTDVISVMSTQEREDTYTKAQSVFEDADQFKNYSVTVLTQTMTALISTVASDNDEYSRIHGYTLLAHSLRYGGKTHAYLTDIGEVSEFYLSVSNFIPTLQNLSDPEMRRDGFEFIYKLAVDILGNSGDDDIKTAKKITHKLFTAVEAEDNEDAFQCGFEAASTITTEWASLCCEENQNGNNIDEIVEICVEYMERMHQNKRYIFTEADDQLDNILNETILHNDVLRCLKRQGAIDITRKGRSVPLPACDQRLDSPDL